MRFVVIISLLLVALTIQNVSASESVVSDEQTMLSYELQSTLFPTVNSQQTLSPIQIATSIACWDGRYVIDIKQCTSAVICKDGSKVKYKSECRKNLLDPCWNGKTPKQGQGCPIKPRLICGENDPTGKIECLPIVEKYCWDGTPTYIGDNCPPTYSEPITDDDVCWQEQEQVACPH